MVNNKAEVTVAKFGALQAITVALITAVAGIVTGYIARGGVDNNNFEMQHWIVIEDIVSKEHKVVRVVISVNGVNYSFPSKKMWAEVGPNLSSEKFPLPNTKDNYKISFSAFVSDRGPLKDIFEYQSNEIQPFSKKQLPLSNQIYYLNKSDVTYGGMVTDVYIKFGIE
jgi:hypothetical protein